TADFGALSNGINQLNDNISFIKLGYDTTAVLYSNAQYSGSSQTIGQDTCLQGSVVGDKTASSLKIFYSKQVLISSRKCENCNLAGVDLSGLPLQSVDLAYANLRGANLSNSDISSAIFTGANLSGAKIAGANLQGAALYCTDLSNIDFTPAGIKFDSNPLIKKDFSCRTSLRGSTFSINVIKPQIWKFMDLNSANIIGSNGKDLNGTDLSSIDMSGIILTGVNLTGVKLDSANLGCDAAYAVCSNLTNVQLNNASLKKTDLNNAVLCGANFSYANLEGANLYKAFLNGSSSSSNIAARFTGAFLKNANLSYANMSGADFSNANLFADSTGTCQGGNKFLTACASAQYATMNSVNF
ncbi:MAG: pentapeptide repeat-containing protein, partial [Nitrospirae bacterium]|nr:pentapeptide repeat-containing protein [Nitrospirota bacterium]